MGNISYPVEEDKKDLYRLHWCDLKTYGDDITDYDKKIDNLIQNQGYVGICIASISNYEIRLIKKELKNSTGKFYCERDYWYDSEIRCTNTQFSIIFEKQEDKDLIINLLNVLPRREHVVTLKTNPDGQRQKLKSMTTREDNAMLFVGDGNFNVLSCVDSRLATYMKLMFI